MLKRLESSQLMEFLGTLDETYALQVPVCLADGTRLLQPWGSGDFSLFGDLVQQKPGVFFFPQSDLLLYLRQDGSAGLPVSTGKPLALFGLSAVDLAGIAFLDRFFAQPPADDAYLRRRQGVLLIGLSGMVGPARQWQPAAGGDCDLELLAVEDGYLGRAYSGEGKKLLDGFPAAAESDLERFAGCDRTIDERIQRLQKVALLLAEDQVPDSFWEEVANHCILCTACNLVCPTCNCFCVEDRPTTAGTERRRVWDSCQFDAFMREASGHNPLGTEALRTRRRIYHKLVADPQRWGELGCVACGRCDRACPTGIGMFALVEEMLQRFSDRG